MSKRKLIIMFGLFFVISIATINTIDTYMHEVAHRQIAIYNVGCSEWDIKIKFFGNSYFNCTEKLDMPENWVQQRRYFDSLNEVVGYNTSTIINAILLVGFFITLAIILRE